MLWDLIRDFFVMHVFGGYTSNEELYDTYLGGQFLSGDLFYKVGVDNGGSDLMLSLSDWLSTTATAISITIIVVLCCMFVYKIVKLIGGLIR